MKNQERLAGTLALPEVSREGAKGAKSGRAGNPEFARLLKAAGLTVGQLAAGIFCGRSRVSEALNNKPGRGRHIRPKVTRYLQERYPEQSEQMLQALGWSPTGVPRRGEGSEGVPRGTLHVEQM